MINMSCFWHLNFSLKKGITILNWLVLQSTLLGCKRKKLNIFPCMPQYSYWMDLDMEYLFLVSFLGPVSDD